MPDWRIVPYQGVEGLHRLEADWLRLYEELPYRAAYHTFGAATVYLRHLCPSPDTFTCFALSDGDRIRAICPLERTTQRVFASKVPLGVRASAWRLPQHPHWSISDVICPEGEPRAQLLPLLVKHLRRTQDPAALLVLGPAPEYSAIWEGLRSLRRSQHCTHLRWASHVNDCTVPFSEIISSLGKTTRGRIRKAHRRLDEHEEVRFMRATEPADLQAELESFLAVEASGWKGPNGTGTAILCEPAMIDFYRDLAHTLGTTGQCEINTLYVDGRCIAGEFCAVGREDYARLKIGYDEDYVALIPSKLLFEKTLERCCKDPGIMRLNALTEVLWLPSWGATSVPVQQAHVAILQPIGTVLIALLRLQWLARDVVHGLRAKRAQRAPASPAHSTDAAS